MYIDFHKYNYRLIPEKDRRRYIERDKNAYKEIIKNWLEKEIEQIVERKWQIEEIFVLREISDFIKLLKEAEALYELGFFTGCIALVGISSEDFSKYLALKIDKKDLTQSSQNERLKVLFTNQAITGRAYNLLDNIRKLRNECLHYNNDFKARSTEELKNEAITALNDLKTALKIIIGHSVEIEVSPVNLYEEVVDNLAKTQDPSGVKQPNNLDEFAFKIRNATSHLLKLPLACDPERKTLIREMVCEVIEIDYEASDAGEITLFDMEFKMHVIVDLDDENATILKNSPIKEGDILECVLHSNINKLGMSGTWKFWFFQKFE